MDARPHLAENLRPWLGDSRGRLEGETLAVETTNFVGQAVFLGSGKDLHLIERFTRIATDVLIYEFTIDDRASFTQPWTVQVPMTKSQEAIYEYACHEGNHGLSGILTGARAMEQAEEGKKSWTK